jgi:hypothetical protein
VIRIKIACFFCTGEIWSTFVFLLGAVMGAKTRIA